MLQADAAAIKFVPFSLARSVAMRVLTAPALVGKVFLEGGACPLDCFGTRFEAAPR